jgi:hypothetical protein
VKNGTERNGTELECDRVGWGVYGCVLGGSCGMVENSGWMDGFRVEARGMLITWVGQEGVKFSVRMER